MRKTITECFQVLGLSPGVTPEQAKQAHRFYIQAFHPDRFPVGSKARDIAHDKLVEINHAWEELSKFFAKSPAGRQMGSSYDGKKAHGAGPAAKAASTGATDIKEGLTWQLATRYLRAVVESGKSAKTAKNYRSDLILFLSWLEEAQAGRVLRNSLEYERLIYEYADELSERGYRGATIARGLYAVKGLMEFAGAQAPYVTPLARLYKSKQRAPLKYLTPRRLDRFLGVLEINAFPEEEAIVRLLLHTGITVGELCALTWKDISLVGGSRKRVSMHVLGRAGKREVPLNNSAIDALRDLGLSDVAAVRTGKLLDQKIASIYGRDFTPKMVHYLIDRYGTIAKTDVTPSILRHTFCKKLADSGVPLQHLAQLIGVTEQSARVYYLASSQKGAARQDELFDAVKKG